MPESTDASGSGRVRNLCRETGESAVCGAGKAVHQAAWLSQAVLWVLLVASGRNPSSQLWVPDESIEKKAEAELRVNVWMSLGRVSGTGGHLDQAQFAT